MGVSLLIVSIVKYCRYIENDEDIKKYFAAFHLHENFPAAVIIDDFSDFFNDR